MNLSRTSTSQLAALADDPGQAAENAWQEFLDRNRAILLAVVRRLGLSSDAAEDVAQEALLRCWQAIRDRRSDPQHGRLRPFLISIARHCAIDRLRKDSPSHHHRGDSALDITPTDGDALEATFDQEFRRKILQESMDLLANRSGFAPETLLAFERVHIDGHPAAEVARELGVQPQVVYNATARCGARLRELVAELRERYELD